MNKTVKGSFGKFGSMTLALLTTMFLVSGEASAKDRKDKVSGNQAQVVAHISFSGLAAVDMAMQKKVDDKYYLYVQHSKDQGISIVDISSPAKTKEVGVIPWPDSNVSSRINLTGNLGIIAESESSETHSSNNDDLVLWDLSNPAAPRVVQKFSGVVKWLRDERNFIYVLNGEGLWVVSEPTERQPQAESSGSYGM
jgi:hypothetical protein